MGRRSKAEDLEYSKKYYSEHREERLEYARKYRESHAEEMRAAHKEWYYKNRDEVLKQKRAMDKINRKKQSIKARERKLKKIYSITIEEYRNLLNEQGGVCLGCRKSPNGKDLCVDHNHETGRIRGLLCSGCNLIIGHAEDNVMVLENLIEYLQNAQAGAAELAE